MAASASLGREAHRGLQSRRRTVARQNEPGRPSAARRAARLLLFHYLRNPVTQHRLDPSPANVVDVFSRDHAPVLTVDPGDSIVVRSLDASGYLTPQQAPGDTPPRMLADARGHCLTGPIAVRGAEPGTVLAVHLVSLRPDNWGWTVAAARDNVLTRRLGVAAGPPSWLLWHLDLDTCTAQPTTRVSPVLWRRSWA